MCVQEIDKPFQGGRDNIFGICFHPQFQDSYVIIST